VQGKIYLLSEKTKINHNIFLMFFLLFIYGAMRNVLYLVSMPKSFSISGFLTASIPASATASGNLSGEAVARTT
jgi:hypothetical protein